VPTQSQDVSASDSAPVEPQDAPVPTTGTDTGALTANVWIISAGKTKHGPDSPRQSWDVGQWCRYAFACLYPREAPPWHTLHWRSLRKQIIDKLVKTPDCPKDVYGYLYSSTLRKALRRFYEDHGLPTPPRKPPSRNC
jgi:hypothetical protein